MRKFVTFLVFVSNFSDFKLVSVFMEFVDCVNLLKSRGILSIILNDILCETKDDNLE